jgi:NAD-dependent DNA ligase
MNTLEILKEKIKEKKIKENKTKKEKKPKEPKEGTRKKKVAKVPTLGHPFGHSLEKEKQGSQPKVRKNEKLISLMDELYTIMMKKGEVFKARAYKKAQETIMSYDGDITDIEQLKGKPGIGETIMLKMKEFDETGTLQLLEKERNKPENILSDVYGIGPKKAKELVEKGITNIEQLREKQTEVLNDVQKSGLKYYEDILERIPRSEIDEYKGIFEKNFKKVADDDSRYEIVGSYRRGAEKSGDIDVIITSGSQSVFKKFIDLLLEEKIILEVLSRGTSKCLVIAKIPSSKYARRVDFLYSSQEEYPFSVLYFTGSKAFNTVMRGHALRMGYSLNEHTLSKMVDKKKTEKVDHIFKTETDIFDFLKLKYKEPKERIDGRSVENKDGTPVKIAEIPQSDIVLQPEPIAIKEPKTKKIREPKEPKPPKAPKTRKMREPKAHKEPKTKKIREPKNPKEPKPPKEPKTRKIREPKEPKEKKIKIKDVVTISAMSAKKLTEEFKKKGMSVLELLSENQLEKILIEANAAYYNKSPLLTDNEYDIVKEYTERKFPENQVVKQIGAPVEKNKVTLPYEMPSMDKIKPDTNALPNWLTKYKGPYVLSCKLDGVSGMYSTEGDKAKLYTRGDGKVGQDITHLLKVLNLPKEKGMVVRGEFIIPKKVFEEKYNTEFANPRNMVAGIVNSKTIDAKASDLHFVAYEVIQPPLIPSEQMKKLISLNHEVVRNQTVTELSNEYLSSLLLDWRKNYEYEIDGVIVTNDEVYPRKSGNPDHAFAFKMVMTDQVAEAKVVDVIWTPSKSGYLKPRVRIEPIQLGGVTIEYATGFNGKFIEDNKIGIGAVIELIRSGDVIPYIKSVTTPAEKTKMPDIPYIWTDTHVDIMLENAGEDDTVREKNITAFFVGIGVDGLSTGNVKRLIKAGHDTVPKIIRMQKADFEKVEGFKTKMVEKLYNGIKEKLASASLVTIMAASNILGRGLGERKIKPIMDAVPDILTRTVPDDEKIKLLRNIPGIGPENAKTFVSNISNFNRFMEEIGVQKDKEPNVESAALENTFKETVDVTSLLYGKKIVMTKVRDKEIIEKLPKLGATLEDNIKKDTFVLIVKSKDDVSNKTKYATENNISIMTPEEFKEKYF